MSWRDREYNHGGHGGGGALNGVMAVLNGCVPLGRWFGIRVRVHASLILFVVLTMAFGPSGTKGVGLGDVATAMGLSDWRRRSVGSRQGLTGYWRRCRRMG
jgi:hypothetical protein